MVYSGASGVARDRGWILLSGVLQFGGEKKMAFLVKCFLFEINRLKILLISRLFRPGP
jgi:hypothetical protein